MKKQELGVYAPWVILYQQIKTLFAKDPDIRVEYNNENRSIKIYVDNTKKAEALAKIMPTSKVFGNIVVNIEIVPANIKTSYSKYLQTIFEGNEAFSHMTVIEEIPDMYISNPIAYCSFKKEVVQYPADDLSSETGLKSTLYEDLAREVFGDVDGVFFCTDSK